VLLIVCTNVANLLLTRATARQNDIATRRSLGATRSRIARQVLTESLVLAAFGGVGGILLAYGGVALLKTAAVIDLPSRFQSGGATILPRLDEVAVDPAVLAVVAVLALVSGLVFGAAPALRLARLETAPGARAATEGRQSRHSSRVLATAQVAFALMLLVAASLLLNSFVKLAAVDPGFDGENVLTVDLVPPDSYGPPQQIETASTVVERLRSNPLVTAAGFTSSPPLSRRILIGYAFTPPGWTLEDLNEIENALPPEERTQLRLASPGYLRALGARLLHGRWVDERNAPAGTLEVLVTRSYVRRHFREENPVGVTLQSPFAPATIVGVLDDLHMRALDADPESIVFADPAQLLAAEVAVRPDAVRAGATFLQTLSTDGSIAFAVRTRGDPLALAAELQAIGRDIDAALVVDNAIPMDDVLFGLTTRPRFYALLLGIFGAVAAAIAVIGVYGVLAYSVGRRTRELGVRMALGAESASVLRLVMREGVLMIAIGVGLGLVGAAAATRYLEGMLFGLGTLDAATYVAAAAGFAAIALLASYVPARHATRIDPLAALRHE
jgi:putative ABC transport system permease protein